ncbi:radical SAM/SPASM domain-containing protein [Bacteroides sp. f07]|uniref:radical SAM/SPASM domain-containing protein n=1 Tax=Bacteroides sp. f07 TaxID=3132704 RepID=UPI0034ABF713
MELIKQISPRTISLLTTYYCTAACKNCCFECNQDRKGKMSFEQIKMYINKCTEAFPTIQLVVFSGGECFSLKDDLYHAVQFANERGLMTRVVSNGYWASSYDKAYSILKKMKALGLNELNLSTGDDHQVWVPFNNIVNAIKASAELDLVCLVNIETNPNSTFNERNFREHEELKEYIKNNKVAFSSGIWIPFNSEDKIKRDINYNELLQCRCLQRPVVPYGCTSLFESIPIDVEGYVYACCGLACKRVKYLKLGNINSKSIQEIYAEQFDDFLKVWAYVDGPKFILKKIAEDRNENIEINVDMHNCEACLALFNDCDKIEYVRKNIHKYASNVILKYNVKQKNTEKNEK